MFLFALGVLLFIGQVENKAVERRSKFLPFKNETAALELAHGFLDDYNSRLNTPYMYTLDGSVDSWFQEDEPSECYILGLTAAENHNCLKKDNKKCDAKPNASDKRINLRVKIRGPAGHRTYNQTQIN